MQNEAKDAQSHKSLKPGDMFGDYTVEKLLGEGGMGAVYLVRAPDGERYAVKVMFPDMVKKGSDYRKRFAREAEFAMKIRHKNLISVYDVGEDPDTGLCYIIMAYVPGGSVADRLEHGGPLPMTEAVAIAAQVAMALEVAHRHGVIHRDIKPDNIMFDADGTPKLADLGVAKFTDGAHKTTVTTTGMIIGTPAYMAPEQMMDSHHIDARADIYALGVVLYEMLTGKRPNADSTAVELLAKAIKGEPLPDVRTMRPEISAAVAHVLSLMCAPKPEGRPATALEAAQLLHKAVTGRLVLPKKPPRAADASARKKKRAVPWTLLAVCAIVCALCVAIVANLLGKPTPQDLRQSIVITNVTERTVVLTNTIERVTIVTNLVGNVPALPTNGSLLQVAAKSKEKFIPAKGEPIVPYVSKNKLHALYRSKDRKHVFLGTGHALGGDGFATPPYSLARIKEMISVGAEIIHFHVSRSKDGILFSSKRYHLENVSNGTGNARDYTAQDLKKLKVKWRESVSSEGFATCEDILRTGKGKVLFNISGAEDYAREIEYLLNRLDAWESVILEGGDVDVFRQKYGRNIWRKFQTGEAQVMVGDAYLHDWRKVTPECMVWGRDLDLVERGLTNIPERITCMFFDKPGPGLRTDDEAGWQKAISEGVTVLRTSRPVELRRYIDQISSRHDSVSATELVRPYGLVIKAYPKCAKATIAFQRLDRSPTAWAYSFKEEKGWEGAGFDDSLWKCAPGGFGRRENAQQLNRARLNTEWSTKSLFLRRRFNWDGGDISRVVVDAYHDDDMTIWLNGRLMMTANGSNSDYQPFEIPARRFAKAIRKGENVFCVEVHNDWGCQYFDCGLMVECGGIIEPHVAPEGIRHVKTAAGTWTVMVVDGIAQIGDGRNVALDPHPKGALKIPSELDGLPIRKLAARCFRTCEGIESVNIPEGIRSVGQAAFFNCKNLSSITVPESLEHLGVEALHNTRLTRIDLKNVRLLEGGVFKFCERLDSVSVNPDNPTFTVKDGVLYDKIRRAVVVCPRSRKSYVFPVEVEDIYDCAFHKCKITSIEIPETVKVVGHCAFEGALLENVKFKGTDAVLCGWSFGNLPSLKSVVLPSRLKSLDEWAIFHGAGQLESISLPDTVVTIGDGVFEDCPRLKNIYLGMSLQTVKYRAFNGCRQLRKIRFPATLKKLGAEAFRDCRSLGEVFFDGNAPSLYDQDSRFGHDIYKNASQSLVTFVSEGSIGWSGDSPSLPKVWPVDGGESARPIRYENANSQDASRELRQDLGERTPGTVDAGLPAVSSSPQALMSTNAVPVPSGARRQEVVLFPSASPDLSKWKARAPWRYMTKHPAPSAGNKWTEPTFHDSGWKRTNKPLGAGKSKEIMRIADRWSSSWRSRHRTTSGFAISTAA